MTRTPRVLASSVAFVFLAGVLASCGGPTGESAASPSAAPATSAPVATAAPVTAKALILQVDTVRSPEGLTDAEKAYLSCVQQSRFPQGSRIVWRVKVIEPLTSANMDDKALKSVVVNLPNGTASPLKWGGHGGPNKTDDFFWTAGFSLAKDYPTGAFNYTIKATSVEGLVGTWDQFKVAAAMLTVVPAGTR